MSAVARYPACPAATFMSMRVHARVINQLAELNTVDTACDVPFVSQNSCEII